MTSVVLKMMLQQVSKSWTVWAGLLMWVLTSLPPVMQSAVEVLGPLSPEMAAKMTAAILVLARLRGIMMPILSMLGIKETDNLQGK